MLFEVFYPLLEFLHRGLCWDGRLFPPEHDANLEFWVCQPNFFKEEMFFASSAMDVNW
jgi:hypothetical protein